MIFSNINYTLGVCFYFKEIGVKITIITKEFKIRNSSYRNQFPHQRQKIRLRSTKLHFSKQRLEKNFINLSNRAYLMETSSTSPTDSITATTSLITISLLFLGILIFIFISLLLLKRKQMNSYIQSARNEGITVYQLPYAWLGAAVLKQFAKSEQLYGDAIYHYKKHGSQYDIVVSNIMHQTVVEFINPQLVKLFYQKLNDGYYQKSTTGFVRMKMLSGWNNLLLLEGEAWKKRKQVLSKVFNYDFIKDQIPVIDGIVKEILKEMEEKYGDNRQSKQQKQIENKQKSCINCSQKSTVSSTYDITEALIKSYSAVILRCFFHTGDDHHLRGKDYITFMNELLAKITLSVRLTGGIVLEPIAHYGPRAIDRQIIEEAVAARNKAKSIIKERLKQIQEQTKLNRNEKDTENVKPRRKDLVEALVEANSLTTADMNENSSDDINIETLINQFAIFMLAGSETTMSLSRMIVYRMMQNPQVEQKLRKQIEEELGDNEITYQGLKKLKYLQCVEKETLRMDSSANSILFRTATKDHYIGKLPVKQGMMVNVRFKGLQFREAEYDDPLCFKPERWMDNKQLGYSFIPFSSGARTCIGKHLAKTENKIFIVNLLRRYKTISIDKKEFKMVIRTFYGPEEIKTTLEREGY